MLPSETVQLRRNVDLEVSYTARQATDWATLPALVFLHGGMGNRCNWRSQYEFAQAKGWEALAYDLAGHGESSAYRRYSIGRHRRDLQRLLQHYGITSPLLCCHSYGVPIGIEWAQRHPTAGLILVAGGTHDLAPWWEIPLIKALAWGGRHLFRYSWLQRATKAMSSQQNHATIDRFLSESPVPTAADPYTALEIFWDYNFFTRRRPQKLDMPVLVISGGQDSMFSKEMGEALAVTFPNSEHLHLPEAGHLLIAEYPQVVNKAIANFIVSLQPHSLNELNEQIS
ncbi:MAG: alpha/beta hydrolase [Phormidesmis sp.]